MGGPRRPPAGPAAAALAMLALLQAAPGAAAAWGGNSSFDYYRAQVYWPASHWAPAKHGEIRWLIGNGYAPNDFWTHGLWPTSLKGRTPTSCNVTHPWDPAAMRGLDQSLPYWMSFSLDRSDAKHDSMFWRHEWDKHGSCTGLDQRTYFMAAYYMSSSLQLLRGLQAEGVVPSNTRRYALADLEAAVAKVTGGPLLPKALLCARDPRTRGALQLTRVTVCVDKTSVLPAPCPPSATGTVVEDAADADDALTSTGVPDDRNTPGLGVLVDCRTAHGGIFFPALVDGSTDSGQLWLWGNKGDWAWLLGLAVLAICMGAAWMMAPRSHAGAARLLAGSVGGWPGCRTACCAPTPTVVHNPLAAVPLVIHEHALDVAAVRAADPALGRALDLLPTGVALSGDAARRAVLAGVLADPRPPNPAGLVADVLVIVSHGDGQALPADDGQALSADEASIAEAAERMYLGDNSAMRCVTPLPASRIGHWLATRPVVQDEVLVLRPPGSDSCIALASADALFDIRDRLARPAVHTIAAWEVDDDGRPVAAQLGVASAVAAALSGEADAYELDEATLAHVRRRRLSKLALFRVLFPSHSNNAAFSRAVDALLADGLLSRRDLRDAGGPNRLWGTLIDAANDEATRRGTRFVLDGVGVGTVDALLAEDGAKKAKLAGPLEFKKEGGAANVQLPAGLVEGLPLFDWRASEGALAERLARRALESLGGVPKPVSVADICEPQSDGAANEPVQQKLDAKTVQSPFFRGTGQASKAGPPPADVDAVTRSARGRRLAAAASATTESGLLTASRRLATSGFSAKASAASCCKPPAPGDALAASFYQRPIHDDDAILDAGDTLVRERPSVVHLISFLLGVAALSKVRLFAAYALLLLSVVVRLLVPLAYAEALSAMVSAYGIGLHTNTVLAVGLTGAAIVLRGAGTLVLADFARHALSTMYGRLFNHILYQDATSFIEHLPPGELMVRASGSSLTLRTLVTTTAFQLVEGVILFFGTIAMMLMSASGLMSRSEPGMRVVVLAVSGLAIAEGIYAGRFMWKQNLAVRRGLGSTFGFSSDTVGAPATVAAMGARPRLEQDFVRFLGDYVAAAYVQGVAKSTHSALAELCSIVMRLSILWLTAKSMFKGDAALATVYALYAYSFWLGTALSQMAGAYGTGMADVGSLERLVELHDRGAIPTHSVAGRDLAKSQARAFTGGVRLAGVKVSYPRSAGGLALGGVDLRVAPGRACVLRGPSLSGKSTLLDVLALRVVPFKGEVQFAYASGGPQPLWLAFDWVDGDRRALRARLAVVSVATAAVFPASLKDNLLAGAPDAGDTNADEACRLVGLDVYAASLPSGMDTLLGDAGVPVPPGVALRIALARAVLRRAALVLVDDADVLVAELGAPVLGAVLAGELRRGAAVVVAGVDVDVAALGLADACDEASMHEGCLKMTA